MRIYLDASVAIDASDLTSSLHSKILPALQQIAPKDTCISDLVRLKCLIQPIRHGNSSRIADLQSFFGQANSLPMESAVFNLAAQLRASHSKLKTPDALHLATALHHGCSEFWTNDLELAKMPVGLSFRSF